MAVFIAETMRLFLGITVSLRARRLLSALGLSLAGHGRLLVSQAER